MRTKVTAAQRGFIVYQCTLKRRLMHPVRRFFQQAQSMERVLVSACLLGEKVRYHGGDATCGDPILNTWLTEGRVVRVCPEQEGDLPTPRPPAEIAGGDGAA